MDDTALLPPGQADSPADFLADQVPPPPAAPLLLNARQAAALCNISPATWNRLTDSGKNPAAVRLNTAVRWRRSDLERWVELGCPHRAAFDSILADDRKAHSRKGRPR